MKTILAIDPGLSGGLAVMQFGKTDCHAMPETLGDVFELIASFQAASAVEGYAMVCVLEEVSGFAGKAQPGSAMFKFGEHYGFVQGVVRSLGIRLELVRPQVWQKAFGLGTASRCASKSVWKNKLKAEAQRRYPQLKVTLKTADALLILDFALQRRGPASESEAARTRLRADASARHARTNGRNIEHSTSNTKHRSGECRRGRRSASHGSTLREARSERSKVGIPKPHLGINTEAWAPTEQRPTNESYSGAWVGEDQNGERRAERGSHLSPALSPEGGEGDGTAGGPPAAR